MLDVHEIPFSPSIPTPRLVAARAAARASRSISATRRAPEFLARCGIETARAVVVTMDAPAANEAVVADARELRPDMTLVARARDAEHARALYDLGVTDAVPETIEASLQLSRGGAGRYRRADGLVIASIHEKRDEYRKLLIAAGAPERPRTTRKAGRA